MQRPAVAANEQGGASHKTAQLRQREFPTRQNRVALGNTQPGTGPISNLTGSLHLGRTGRQDDTTNRVRRAKLNCERFKVPAGQRRNGFPALTCTTISR